MIISVLLPNGSTVLLPVLATDVVFDGENFLSGNELAYVELYTVPINAVSLPFDNIGALQLVATVNIRALVLGVVSTDVPVTDPLVISYPDPSGGECICGITCSGTELRFVQVHTEA